MTRPVQDPTVHRELQRHGYQTRQLLRRPVTVARSVEVMIKCIRDTQTLVVGDALVTFPYTTDMDGMCLKQAEAYVYDESTSGDIEIQVRRSNAADMLTVPITIEEADRYSVNAAVQPVVDESVVGYSGVNYVAIDIDAAGADATGLVVALWFGLPVA